MKIAEIPVTVRIESEGGLIIIFGDDESLFHRKGESFRECFTFRDGHNSMQRGYYERKTIPAPEGTAREFIAKVQAYYDSLPPPDFKLVQSSRLSWQKK